MCDYKEWMDNLNAKDKNNIKFKPNIFRIILFNLLNNDKNINTNIPLLIMNNYLIWAILHKLNIPQKILDHFLLHIFSKKENKGIKEESTKTNETPQNSDSSESLYKNFIFDEVYLMKNYENKAEPDYATNFSLIEKLCLNLENRIILSKMELIYI